MTTLTDCSGKTIYYPYSWALQFARGAALNLLVESSTTKSRKWTRFRTWMWPDHSTVAMERLSLFILNRDLVERSRTRNQLGRSRTSQSFEMLRCSRAADLKAVNSFQSPQKVAAQTFAKPATSGSRTKFEVPRVPTPFFSGRCSR